MSTIRSRADTLIGLFSEALRSWVMVSELKPHRSFKGAKGPVVVAVLDGVGIGRGDEADAVQLARTPTLDSLWSPDISRTLVAHGKAVGLPSDGDMGNSEVGHNAIGCGVVHDQGAKLVANAIADGSLFEGAMWDQARKRCAAGGALHFIGLLSDGNVHSHINHLIAMIRRAAGESASRIFVHVLLDGRDVEATSALRYIDQLEEVLAEVSTAVGTCGQIASGGGRMIVTMDRYEADWTIVETGWNAHVHGNARRFASAREAVETFRGEDAKLIDQYLPPFVIAEDSEPVGRIANGDTVLCFNFRGDRAIEISRAFDDDEFTAFDRGARPDVLYAGMMEYDGDTHVPRHYLVEPPNIDKTLGEYLVASSVSQLAISETQKFGHVTYFWNGNRSGMFDPASETYIEIASDNLPYEERPWMKAAEITDRLIAELRTGKHRFARVNYANGDMVGHTGSLSATIVAMEAIDLSLTRLCQALTELDGILLITADHGNADEMYQRDKRGRVIRDQHSGDPVVKTSHTLSPVPLMIFDPNRRAQYRLTPRAPHSQVQGTANSAGIANITSTAVELLGLTPPANWLPSLLEFA